MPEMQYQQHTVVIIRCKASLHEAALHDLSAKSALLLLRSWFGHWFNILWRVSTSTSGTFHVGQPMPTLHRSSSTVTLAPYHASACCFHLLDLRLAAAYRTIRCPPWPPCSCTFIATGWRLTLLLLVDSALTVPLS